MHDQTILAQASIFRSQAWKLIQIKPQQASTWRPESAPINPQYKTVNNNDTRKSAFEKNNQSFYPTKTKSLFNNTKSTNSGMSKA